MGELLAYFAGIIDGEGCINIGKSKYPKYWGRVEVVMKDAEAILLLHENYGGCFCKIQKGTLYHWSLSSKQAVKFLRDIYPYLQIKKNQADVIFQLEETKKLGRNQWQPLSAKEKQYREDLYLQLRRVHKGG